MADIEKAIEVYGLSGLKSHDLPQDGTGGCLVGNAVTVTTSDRLTEVASCRQTRPVAGAV